MFIEPYSDEYLFFNEQTGQYEITAQNLLDNYGIELNNAVNDNPNSIKAVLRLATTSVYNFIHKHSLNTCEQDWIISHTESGRKIINDALCQQFLYIKQAGYLSRSTDITKRALKIDDDAAEILEQIIPEVGYSILYTGTM